MTRKEILDALFQLQSRDQQLSGQLKSLISTIEDGMRLAARVNDPSQSFKDVVLTVYRTNQAKLPTPPPYMGLVVKVNGTTIGAEQFSIQKDELVFSLPTQPKGATSGGPLTDSVGPFMEDLLSEKAVTVSYVHAGILESDVLPLIDMFPELEKGEFVPRLQYWATALAALQGMAAGQFAATEPQPDPVEALSRGLRKEKKTKKEIPHGKD